MFGMSNPWEGYQEPSLLRRLNLYMLLNSCRGLVCTVARISCNFEAGTMFRSGEN